MFRMRNRTMVPVFCLCLLAFGSALGQSDYVIGAGDQLTITVFGEPDLSPTVKVSEDGTIPYPFLGDVRCAGQTVADIEAALMRGLRGDYLIDPKITVSVAEYRPIFINGEVKSPGSFPFQPGLTVGKAVALAGGLTERGSNRKIFLRSEGEGPDQRRRVDMEAALRPGDILNIEESFF